MTSTVHRPSECHPVADGEDAERREAKRDTIPVSASPLVAPLISRRYWSGLRVIAETFHDVQKQRIATNNRYDRAPVMVDLLGEIASDLGVLEDTLAEALVHEFNKSGFAPFVERHKGLGDKSMARLLGHVGDPYIRSIYSSDCHEDCVDEETRQVKDKKTGKLKTVTLHINYERRNLAKLWAICGHGDPTRKRRKGMDAEDAKALGSPVCKMLVHLIAEGCMKAGAAREEKVSERTGHVSPACEASFYRRIYEARREATDDREDWTLKHKFNDALRITGKEILRDLWMEARVLHGEADDVLYEPDA